MNDSRPGAAVVVGAGLSRWPNAIRALESLGLGERVREHAVETVSRGNFRAPNGRWLRHKPC